MLFIYFIDKDNPEESHILKNPLQMHQLKSLNCEHRHILKMISTWVITIYYLKLNLFCIYIDTKSVNAKTKQNKKKSLQ